MTVNNKAVQRGFSIALYAILAVALVWVVAIAGTRLFGITPYAVTSGSMEPAIPVGAMVYVAPSDDGEYDKGDIVTYKSAAGAYVTHRVIEVNSSDRTVTVQGDANATPDASPVPLSTIVGKTEFAVPNMGFLYAWFDENRIMIIAGMIAIVVGLASASMFFGAAAAQEAAEAEEENTVTFAPLPNETPIQTPVPTPTPVATAATAVPVTTVAATPVAITTQTAHTCPAAADAAAKSQADEDKELLRSLVKRVEEMERLERERKIYDEAYQKGQEDAKAAADKAVEKYA